MELDKAVEPITKVLPIKFEPVVIGVGAIGNTILDELESTELPALLLTAFTLKV